MSEVGFEPTPLERDQNSPTFSKVRINSPWVWRLRPLGHPDNSAMQYCKSVLQNLYPYWAALHWFLLCKHKTHTIRSSCLTYQAVSVMKFTIPAVKPTFIHTYFSQNPYFTTCPLPSSSPTFLLSQLDKTQAAQLHSNTSLSKTNHNPTLIPSRTFQPLILVPFLFSQYIYFMWQVLFGARLPRKSPGTPKLCEGKQATLQVLCPWPKALIWALPPERPGLQSHELGWWLNCLALLSFSGKLLMSEVALEVIPWVTEQNQQPLCGRSFILWLWCPFSESHHCPQWDRKPQYSKAMWNAAMEVG